MPDSIKATRTRIDYDLEYKGEYFGTLAQKNPASTFVLLSREMPGEIHYGRDTGSWTLEGAKRYLIKTFGL